MRFEILEMLTMPNGPDFPKNPLNRPLFAARKLALMASVVAGLGIATYGLTPNFQAGQLFSTPAQAQVNNAVRNVQQPIGFADIVERVKPSVISVRVKSVE